MNRVLGTSPKTTLWGIVTAIGGVLVALNTIDGAEQAFDRLFTDASTWAKIVGTFMLAIGGVVTARNMRDNSVSSEEAKA